MEKYNRKYVELVSRSQNETNSSRRFETCSDIVRDLLTDYFQNTNLNDNKYNKKRKLLTAVRWFCLIMFFSCTLLCIVFTSKLWIKWSQTSLVIMNADTLVPVHQIPFPALTVCLETKSMASKYNFTENYHLYNNSNSRAEMSDYDRDIFEDLTLVCDSHLSSAIGRNFSDPKDVLSNIKSVAPDINEAFFVCKWNQKMTECAESFSQILTEEGICYTFNMLGNHDIFKMENLHHEYNHIDNQNNSLPPLSWNLESGYSTTDETDTYPKRGSGYSGRMGLAIVIKQNKEDLDYLCRGPVQGSKVILHNPAEFPTSTSNSYVRTAVNKESVVSVKPKMISTSKALRSYPPERRQCYFSEERYLHYFKVYTESNCELECLSNYTYEKCGCVHIGMPRGPDMKVCNTGKVECMNEARYTFMKTELDGFLGQGDVRHCNCLPSCTSIEYESEISQADYDFKALVKAYRVDFDDEIENLLMSRITVFFKTSQFIASQRREMYGAVDFLADCGGIVGLFLGVSLMSLFKFVYYIILRIYYVVQKNNKRTESDYYETVSDINSQI